MMQGMASRFGMAAMLAAMVARCTMAPLEPSTTDNRNATPDVGIEAVATDHEWRFADADSGMPDSVPADATDFGISVDGNAPDVGPACDPGEGCFLDKCEGNDHCQSGWCVEHMGEGICTIPCQEECPAGWDCRQVAGTDPDVVYICVSAHANLCRPCASADSCKSVGGAEDACISYGVEGSFCGSPCDGDGECPWGFSCADVETVDGVALKQCVADTAICPCTDKSVALGLFTPCFAVNDWGTCQGKRVCTDEGLTDCSAAVPAVEECNGLDDDCNGDTDEETCDDGNACTEESCLGEAGCEYVALESGECMDGNPCTVADHCETGVCVGDPVVCDDENPCTDNICTETGGCMYPPNAQSCNDGNPCTLGDECVDGECTGIEVPCDCIEDPDCAALEDGDTCNGQLFCNTDSVPYECEVAPETVVSCAEPEGANAPCLAAFCAPESGACSLVPTGTGLPCEDGDQCTLGDTCLQGVCTGGAPANCNDGNPCTDDSCETDSGCTNVPNGLGCDDGNICTLADLCAGGDCQSGAEMMDCGDNNPCTDDWCDPAAGCKHAPAAGECSDDNACTKGDLCKMGVCVGGSGVDCDDGNPCTTDSCSLLDGCLHSIVAAACDDEDPCTLNDTCVNGVCAPGVTLDCDDANPCTDDSCGGTGVCLHSANEAPCDDENECTLGETCVGGACVAEGLLECHDANPCTDDSCDPVDGCVYALSSAPCDDGDICTTGDFCHLGECAHASKLTCTDGNDCTDDSCDKLTGCLYTSNQAPCDDSNACTASDTCAGGWCLGTEPLSCSDGNICTDDACHPAQGCTHSPNSAPCDDGDACTLSDECGEGTCLGGALLDCGDNNVCTDDSCNPATGCLNEPNQEGCSDGNACTFLDQCSNGNCVPGEVLDCDDSKLCTDDSCDIVLGCRNVDNVAPCDDDDACTVTDVCTNGACVGSGVPTCDDGDHCTENLCDAGQGCIYPPITPCCGNGLEEAGEECDDGNLTPGDGCEADCSLPDVCEWEGVPQLYCNGGCTWSGGSGCDQTEADIFCKLTMCNCNAYATSFQVVTALPQPGFGCTWGPGDDFGEYPQYCVNMNVVYSSGNVLNENGPGSVLANVQCAIQ